MPPVVICSVVHILQSTLSIPARVFWQFLAVIMRNRYIKLLHRYEIVYPRDYTINSLVIIILFQFGVAANQFNWVCFKWFIFSFYISRSNRCKSNRSSLSTFMLSLRLCSKNISVVWMAECASLYEMLFSISTSSLVSGLSDDSLSSWRTKSIIF